LCGVCRNRSMMGEPLFMGDQFRLYSESPVSDSAHEKARSGMRARFNNETMLSIIPLRRRMA